MSSAVGRIVVGVSASIANLAALRAAVDHARRTEGKLVAVLAWSPVGGELAYARMPCPWMLDLWRRAAVERLASAFDECSGGIPVDVPTERVVLRASPGPALLAVAYEPSDLLFIGTGRQGLMRPFHVGVHRYCLTHATCPVVSVPPPEMVRELHGAHDQPAVGLR